MYIKTKTAFIMFFFLLSANSVAHGGYGHHSYHGFCSYDFIVTLGVLALIGLIITLFLGYWKTKNRKAILQWHKNIAIITIAFAALHVFSALVFH